ncbi:MAG: hypothetical protein ACOCXZ_02345 [Chloroflexota bacterium]
MPHTIDWLQTGRVIHLTLYGETTLPEMETLGREFRRMMESGISPVHTVVDISGVERYPRDMRQLQTLLQTARHGSAGMLLVAGANSPMMRTVTTIISQLVFQRGRFRMVESLDEALSLLMAHEPGLEIGQ